MSRVPDEINEGTVLPSAWNMLEHVKMMPLAAKFQEMMCRNIAPTRTTSGSCENSPINASGCHWHRNISTSISTADHDRGGLEGLAYALGLARTVVLASDRRGGECDRHGRQEDALHDATADTESGLRRRAEIRAAPST